MVLSYIESFYAGLWEFFKIWWWFILPIILYLPAKFFYLWWIQWEVWYKEQEWMVLEIIPPSVVERPFRAMEDVFAAIWPIYDGPNWREQWCEGEFYGAPFWFSFEIASIEGQIHFYARILRMHQKMFTSIIHANFSDAEIFEAEDYTKNVPQNIPNNEWDVYGEEYVFMKENPYPIKTYKFFEIRPEEITAEKRMDPIFDMLERMAKMKKGQQFWFQIIPAPIVDEIPWFKEGKKIVEKLARRDEDDPVPSITGEAFRLLAYDKTPFEQEKKEKPILPPEMKLTPGEREVLGSVEEKISKLGFKTTIRGVYVYKKENYDPAFKTISRGYFLHFSSQNLNVIRFWAKTRPKIHYFFRKRRIYNRKKRMFERAIKRFPPKYPNIYNGTMVLNTEELATLFHFPMSTVGLPPSVPRVLSKKGGPPPIIPFE